jgi:two-component system, chemotaxis family, chemotaxis protein CheY
MKFLIVDDSSVVRLAIERDLETGQIAEIDLAADGVEAVRLYEKKKHDVITLDITMPRMDGLTCLDNLLNINPESKILIISALRDRPTALLALKRGASGFLCKPINPDELREAFDLLLND